MRRKVTREEDSYRNTDVSNRSRKTDKRKQSATSKKPSWAQETKGSSYFEPMGGRNGAKTDSELDHTACLGAGSWVMMSLPSLRCCQRPMSLQPLAHLRHA